MYEFGNNKDERQAKTKMARCNEGGWKNSWWKRAEGIGM
jgi:hypothetical protein